MLGLHLLCHPTTSSSGRLHRGPRWGEERAASSTGKRLSTIETRESEAGKGAPRHLRVLHVEDNPADHDLLEILLEQAGFDVELHHAIDAAGGAARIAEGGWDAHFIDARLPDGSGIDLIRRSGDEAPSILMTGLGERETADAALAAGAADFLSKNHLDAETLRRCLRYALERHRLNQRLREHARALEIDGLLVLDERGRILYANAAAEELFGRVAAELTGSDLAVVTETDEAPLHIDRPDGSTVELLARSARSTWEGRPSWLVWLRDDARSAAATERQVHEARDTAISRLTAGIAHDFNNLIGVVIGHLELARSAAAGPALRDKHVAEALRTAERAAALTSRLLAFARKSEPESGPLDVSGFVASLDRAMRRLVTAGVTLSVAVEDGLWAVAEPAALEQVVLNLVNNASDALGGSGAIRIDGARDGDEVVLTVSDDGCGIPEAALERVFEPFFTTKPIGEGTGLGLPMARQSVRLMGGELSLRSGSWGTAVTARLQATAPQERADEDPQQEVDGPKHVGGHVLVVEDEGSIRSLVEAALGGAGYQIVCASSPAEALELLADPDRQVDLLLTDVAMPEMDGFELVDRATATRPDLRAVFMSGYGERALTARGMDPDSAIMLGKPFRLAQLLAAVERALRRD